MHRVAAAIEAAIGIPLLHIADATAEEIRARGLERVGLLGTRFTMEGDFYRGRLSDRHGLDVVVPDEADRDLVHEVIYRELCLGDMRDRSREEFARIMRTLVDRGAEGMILGCTEISLLVRPDDAPVKLFDTAEIHARKAAIFAIG
jgi:aspartate racemase